MVRYLKIAIGEVVYRSSFVVSIPENFIKNTFLDITEYTTFYNRYKKNKSELETLKSNYVSSEIIQYENKELKELINDYVSSSSKVLAKIIVDHKECSRTRFTRGTEGRSAVSQNMHLSIRLSIYRSICLLSYVVFPLDTACGSFIDRSRRH